jgi:mono/diheme cytochrome c family protein
MENPVAASPQGQAAAQKLWGKECAACHGDTGRGDGPQAKKLETKTPPVAAMPAQSDGELFWKITTGRRPMPGYRKTLTDEQRWQLVTYMRTLGAK